MRLLSHNLAMLGGRKLTVEVKKERVSCEFLVSLIFMYYVVTRLKVYAKMDVLKLMESVKKLMLLIRYDMLKLKLIKIQYSKAYLYSKLKRKSRVTIIQNNIQLNVNLICQLE